MLKMTSLKHSEDVLVAQVQLAQTVQSTVGLEGCFLSRFLFTWALCHEDTFLQGAAGPSPVQANTYQKAVPRSSATQAPYILCYMFPAISKRRKARLPFLSFIKDGSSHVIRGFVY